MGVVTIGGRRVGLAIDGAEGADPFVLVHGTTSSRESWAVQVPELAARFRVLRPEMPGSGESDPPSGALEVADLADDVLAAADAAGAARFHLAGWSLGAVVAAAVAARAPERVRSLALVCGWAVTDARMAFTFDLWRRLLAADPELFMRYAFADGLTAGAFEAFTVAGVDGLVAPSAATIAAGSDAQIALDQRVDIAADLAAIAAPTLVVGGVEDRWVDIRHSRSLAAAIAGARLVELPCGHLVPTEQGAELARLLLEHAASA